MGYIETLEPEAELSEDQIEARDDLATGNYGFLCSLFATYPELRPRDFDIGPRPVDPKLTANIKQKLDPLHLAKLEARRIKKVETRRECARVVSRHGPTSRKIIGDVADWFEIKPSDITSRSRLAFVVTARFVAMRLIYDIRRDDGTRKFSYPMIGAFFGGRDHSTVIHALRTFDDRARAYPEMQEAYEALKDG